MADIYSIVTGLILYDLMFNKYITSLLLIKMLKAFTKVFNIKLQSLLHLLAHISLHTVTGTTAIKAMYFKLPEFVLFS